MTRHAMILVVAGLVVTPASAGPAAGDPAGSAVLGREILTKANAAAARLTAISYEAQFYGDGVFADKIPTFQGKVLAKRRPNESRPRVRIEGTASAPGADHAAPFTFAVDGEYVYSVDPLQKAFTRGTQAEAGRAGSNPLFQARYLHPSPFDSELKNDTAEFLGDEDVDGVACSVVGVRVKGAQGRIFKLFFGKKDLLLRRTEMMVQLPASRGRPASTGRLVFSVTGLDAHPTIEDAVFHLTCPEGFRETSWKSPAPRQRAGLLPVGSEAPDWELSTPQGKTVSLKRLRGKVVVLDFWASWCGPCKRAMPGLQKLHERFKGKPVAIYGVNCNERRPNANPMAYIKEKGYTYGQLVKGDAVAGAYRVRGIPCFYVIGPDGKILHAGSGYNARMEEIMAEIIAGALKNKPG